MYVCDTGHQLGDGHTTVVERQETFPVHDVSVTIMTQVRICNQCGADVYDRDLDSRSLDWAYALADMQRQEQEA
jgi:hypothetical protein